MIYKGIELCCPHCAGDLEEAEEGAALQCVSCRRRFPVVLGIPDLRAFPDPYIDLEADRAKGARIAARLDELTFTDLIDYYYSITPAVPPQHAQQYTRGLLGAEARATASLASWERMARAEGASSTACLLDVGCGTAPLLVAAAPQVPMMVGVDIAFRWLVLAKKRLSEAGLDIPLICACAEALPFPEGTFDRVVLDAVVEHVHDQKQALRECHRVLRSGGYLFASTPNRFSLGPDPHTGVWAGALLPDRWVASYVQRLGGIPPRRQLLSASSLARLLRDAGFGVSGIVLPDIPDGQRAQFGWAVNRAVDLYHFLKRWSPLQGMLRLCGPMLHALARRGGAH